MGWSGERRGPVCHSHPIPFLPLLFYFPYLCLYNCRFEIGDRASTQIRGKGNRRDERNNEIIEEKEIGKGETTSNPKSIGHERKIERTKVNERSG